MLRGGEHGHIHSDFRNDANSGKGLDTRRRHNKVKLRKIFLSSGQNQGFQIIGRLMVLILKAINLSLGVNVRTIRTLW